MKKMAFLIYKVEITLHNGVHIYCIKKEYIFSEHYLRVMQMCELQSLLKFQIHRTYISSSNF